MSRVLQESVQWTAAAAQPGAGRDQALAVHAGMNHRPLYQIAKRLIDVVVSVIALAVAGPFIVVGAILVKLTSPGPIFYRAKRAGRHGQPFAMFKLRTMRVGTDSADRKVTDDVDDRITPVGRWLRKFKIDEFPQFWNVLRGDMAIVGPRPEDWDIVQQYYVGPLQQALDVKPGIASPLDVAWYPDLTYYDPPPAGVPMQEHYLKRHLPVQIAEAIRYAQQQSLLVDAQVIVRLIFCVLVRSWLPPSRQALPPLPAASAPVLPASLPEDVEK